MCADVSASMDSATACGPGLVAPSSSVAVPRAGPASAPEGRAFHSLRGRSEFSRIYQEGVRRRKGGVTVVSAPAHPGAPSVGFVAGKRVGNAVRRNRAKRRLRAAMERVTVADAMAYIVIAGPAVVDVDFRRLVGWLQDAVEGDLPAEGEQHDGRR